MAGKRQEQAGKVPAFHCYRRAGRPAAGGAFEIFCALTRPGKRQRFVCSSVLWVSALSLWVELSSIYPLSRHLLG
jgi:hypothetical protein